jgi:glycosyltransferase involved in cell wall biosynthesis
MVSSSPLITVGIVVLNRDWIIDKMLTSLQRQTYPHNRIFVLLVDGESKDNTVQTARQILGNSDFNGYEIVVKKCNIPEGRNICIEKTKGDFLFFWDSDVIMGADALENMVTTGLETKAEILSAEIVSIYLNTIDAANLKIAEALSVQISTSQKSLKEVEATAMGCTLISRKVFSSVQFDPDLTSLEDYDFSAKARRKGVRIFVNSVVQAFDINVWGQWYSDIHIDMPLKTSLRGLRKKTEANVLATGPEFNFTKTTKFFLTSKRYLLYLGYIPALILTVYGLLASNYASFVFPIYLTLFAAWQIQRRGVKRGVSSAIRSIIVGLPFSLLLILYFAKHTLKHKS